MTKNIINPKEHEILWATIDKIAKDHNKSVSALAIAAGLDPTAFNKSKRKNGDLYRMPTMTTILSLMRVVGISWYDWAEVWYSVEKKLQYQPKGQ